MKAIFATILVSVFFVACADNAETAAVKNDTTSAFLNEGLAEVVVDGETVGADLDYSVSGTLGAKSSCFEIVLPEDTEIGVNFAIKAVFEGGDKPLMNIVEADGTNWGDTLALEGVAEMRGLYTNNLTVCLDDQSEAGADAEAVSFVFSVTAL